MITRHILLVISFLHLKDISCQQNDSNKSNGGQSQGILQKSLNQIASNQGLPINLQQILNSRQCPNSQQSQHSQGPTITLVENSQNMQGSVQPSSKGYHQQLVVQRPQVSVDFPNFNAVGQNDQQSFVLSDVHFVQQQNPGTSTQFVGTPIITSQSFQPAPIASSPQTIMTIQPPVNSFIESSPGPYPQSQQIVISGVPSFVIERSQSNYVNTPQFSNTVPYNDPSFSFYSGPPPNLQIVEYSQSGIPNQMIVQPQTSVITSSNQQPIVANNQILPPQNSYPAILQMSVPNQGSKPSTLKSLLPLILNILKERDNCDCCNNCNKKNQQKYGEIKNDNDKKNGFKSKSSKMSDNLIDFDDRNENEYKGSGKKQGRNKKVRYEDSYEDDDDFNDNY